MQNVLNSISYRFSISKHNRSFVIILLTAYVSLGAANQIIHGFFSLLEKYHHKSCFEEVLCKYSIQVFKDSRPINYETNGQLTLSSVVCQTLTTSSSLAVFAFLLLLV